MTGLPELVAIPVPPAFGSSLGQARIRVMAEDFRVTEIPVCEPAGEGEHLWLRVRKRGANTAWVARQLARWAGVGPGAVGYAGLKDRHAVTEQWFSIHLPGRADPDIGACAIEGVELLASRRHGRKLRRGALRGNRFGIRLRDLDADPAALQSRIEALRRAGCPNAFGVQRFGRDAGNLEAARRLLGGERRRLRREERGLYLSAARSELFNRVLAARIEAGTWGRPLPGDRMQLNGRRSLFAIERPDEEVMARAAALEIHPTGPLCGRGEPLADLSPVEQAVLAPWSDWIEGLDRAGVEADRRSLRVRVDDLHCAFDVPGEALLTFTLPAGSFATVLLDQLLDVEDAAREAAA
ncbi:tRNA pseudouridine(13) synthase TruD [Thiohalobacter sp.]|uniref:tRNA pseudouridine(13) synthase TruD n=1 Tax=Thiohalobacter sp. TaxID=2025948 RepID=UPI00261AAB3E|nr:tRNA pseudouridine(13) synthase TruD [Thiohalobacter sp.]